MLAKRVQTDERGASFVQYGAVLLLVGAVAAVVLGSGLPNQVTGLISDALACVVGSQADCEGDDESVASGDNPDDEEGAPEAADSSHTPEDTRNKLPSPQEQQPDPDSSWPFTVTPASSEEGSDGDGDDESGTSGTLSEDESPLYEDPGAYPQLGEYEQSQEDYRSLGEGESGFCFGWEVMCCPGNTCNTIEDVNRSITLARVACYNPLYRDEQWAYCRPTAADYFEHFLEGSGDDMPLDMDTFLEEVPEFQEEVDQRQQELIDEALAEAEERDIDGPLTIPISTEKEPWGYPEGDVNGGEFVYDNPDYANAIGSFHYWLEGEITVYPPDDPDGDHTYEMDTSVDMEKWYDWERDNTDPVFSDWKQNIAGYSQSDLAELHQYGMAQEFWIRGGTDLPTVEG